MGESEYAWVTTRYGSIPYFSTNYFKELMSRYYLEVSANTPISIVDVGSKERFWFDALDSESKEQAMKFQRYDINRKRFITKKR